MPCDVERGVYFVALIINVTTNPFDLDQPYVDRCDR